MLHIDGLIGIGGEKGGVQGNVADVTPRQLELPREKLQIDIAM